MKAHGIADDLAGIAGAASTAKGGSNSGFHLASGLEHAVPRQETGVVVEPEMGHRNMLLWPWVGGGESVETDKDRSVRMHGHSTHSAEESAARDHVPVQVNDADYLEADLQSAAAVELDEIA